MHALTLVAVLLFLAPLASSIPLAALAAILFVVAWNMSDLKHVAHMLRTAPCADKVILVVTFLLTIFADLVVAVNVGVLLAVLQFLRRMAVAVEVQRVDPGRCSPICTTSADCSCPRACSCTRSRGRSFSVPSSHSSGRCCRPTPIRAASSSDSATCRSWTSRACDEPG